MNAPTLAVKALADVILRAQQQGRQTPMGIAVAIDAAQMVMSPETAAELDRLRTLEATVSPELTPEARAALTEHLGDAKPATGALLVQLGESVRDRLAHDHATQREDWYCMNLAAFMGERMGPVLRRLLNTEAVGARLRGRVAELEQMLAEDRPADEDPITYALTAETGKVTRDAGGITQAEEYPHCGADLGRAEFPFTCHRRSGHDGKCSGTLDGADASAGTVDELTVYRASHESIVMGLYTTATEARAHCVAEERCVWAADADPVFDWIVDADDGVAELVTVNQDGETETFTGYVVTALTVASEYDPEADR